jgi:hypothetical protein
MLAAALQAEVAALIDTHPCEVDEAVTGWWCATAITSHGRW